jgi:hypothetical protein
MRALYIQLCRGPARDRRGSEGACEGRCDVRADGPAPAAPGREAPPGQDHCQGLGACVDKR